MTNPTLKSTNPQLGILSGISLSLVVPIWLLELPASIPTLSVCLVLVLCGGRLSFLLALGQPRLFEISTWSFIYVFFGLAPLIQIQSGNYPETAPVVYLEYLEAATLTIAMAVVLALAGAILSPSGSPSSSSKLVGLSPPRISMPRLRLLAICALCLNAYYLYSVGLSTPLAPRIELRTAQIAAWPNETLAVAIVGLCTMPLLVFFIAFVQVVRNGERSDRLLNTVFMLLTGAALLYSVNPISSPRYYFGTVLMAIAAAFGAYATPRRLRITAISFLLGLVFVFPLADAFRNSSDGFFEQNYDPASSLTSGDFDGLIQTMNTIRFYEQVQPTPGKQALAVALFFVPRSVWEDKPRDSATEAAEYAGYEHLNMSSPLWAELYINGGIFVVGIGMATYGYFVKRLDGNLTRRIEQGGQISPLLVILPFYLIILLRGALLQAMVYLAIFALSSAAIMSRQVARDPVDSASNRKTGADPLISPTPK